MSFLPAVDDGARLRDQLDYSEPKRIVQFLKDHQDIPNRFKAVDRAKLGQILESDLKDPNEQFPIVPPAEEPEDMPLPT